MEKAVDLINRFQNSTEAREREAIVRQIYQGYYNLTKNAVNKFISVLSNEDIEDIIQDTFMKMVEILDNSKWEADIQFRVWLYTTAKFKTLEIVRKRKKEENKVELEDIQKPADNQSQGEAIFALFELWKKTAPDSFDINYPILFEGKSRHEMAEELGVSYDAFLKMR